MYTVLGSTKNRTLRVIWTLEELGVSYDQVVGDPASAEVKALNPTGKVPALILEGLLKVLENCAPRFTGRVVIAFNAK